MCAMTDEARETEGARRDGTSVAENYGKLVLRHVRREQGWLWRLSVYKAVWLRTAVCPTVAAYCTVDAQ